MSRVTLNLEAHDVEPTCEILSYQLDVSHAPHAVALVDHLDPFGPDVEVDGKPATER
jgi:hypothetical protein